MDVSSSKRAPITKKGSSLQLRDGNMTVRFCNRLGCHGRLNHTNVPTNAHIGKNVHSSSGKKTIVGSSMKTSSRKEAEASSSKSKPDVPEICSAETIRAEFQSQSKNSSSRKIRIGEVVGSSSGSPHKVSRPRSVQSNQENSSGLSACLASKSSISCKEPMDNNARMCSLRNASTSNTNLTRNKDIAKKQNPLAIESNISSRGKKISIPTTQGVRGSVRAPSNGISISDSRHQPWSMSSSRASTIPSRTPGPRLSSRSNCSRTSHSLLGESSSRTGRSSHSIGREYSQSGMGSYDQYRDMRLDIDNMSYEELLALGERIGNVSTGISDEHNWKYMWTSNYHNSYASQFGIQCSICQEEYMNGDDMGLLSCKHSYHFACVRQWLRRQKWCPICKVEATPIDPSSSFK